MEDRLDGVDHGVNVDSHGRTGSYTSGPFSTQLLVVDATDPAAPGVRGSVVISTNSVSDVVVRGDLLYVTTNPSPPFEDGLLVVDVANADDPQLVANIDVGDPPRCVTAVGNLLLVGVSQTADGGLVVLDTVDPRVPQPVGRLVVGEYAVAVGAAGVYGLLVTSDRVRAIDLSDPTDPQVVYVSRAPPDR